MALLESVKERFEKVTGWLRPSGRELDAAQRPQGTYDECRASGKEHDRACRSIPKVALPRKDPVYGQKGPLMVLWRRR